MKKFKQVSFLLPGTVDDGTIYSVNGWETTTTRTPRQFASLFPAQFYIEKNSYGVERLCSVCVDGEVMEIVVEYQQQLVDAPAQNFEILIVTGKQRCEIGRAHV